VDKCVDKYGKKSEEINKTHLYPTRYVDKKNKSQVFHSLFHEKRKKKDINLLILHQNIEMWINYLSDSLSIGKYQQCVLKVGDRMCIRK